MAILIDDILRNPTCMPSRIVSDRHCLPTHVTDVTRGGIDRFNPCVIIHSLAEQPPVGRLSRRYGNPLPLRNLTLEV